jgi:hypothetical protein
MSFNPCWPEGTSAPRPAVSTGHKIGIDSRGGREDMRSEGQ